MITSDMNCICDPSCEDCVYDYAFQKVKCNKCVNSGDYEFEGVCNASCPVGTFSYE